VQGACPYANVCEHCPSFRTDSTHLPVLAAQRMDAQALAADAEARGWIDEADRHRRLIARLDAVLAQAVNTRPNPRWFASNAPALNYSKHTSKSPSPPSPSSPGSAGPPSTAIPSCAVIDEHRTRQAEACTLSGLAHRLRTCAPHSKPPPTTSDATKNDYGDSNDEPAVRQAEKLRAIEDR